MQTEPSSLDLEARLSFYTIDEAAAKALRSASDVVKRELPVALDKFYRHVQGFEQARRFFKSQTMMDGARSRQVGHWDMLMTGTFNEAYGKGVRAVGMTHARIGLEPRWYVGGYAVILSHLIEAIVGQKDGASSWFGRGKSDGDKAAMLSALSKAVLLDIDLAISVYIEAAETARRKAEEEQAVAARKAIDEAQQQVVDLFGAAFTAMAAGDLTVRIDTEVPPVFERLKTDFNEAAERLGQSIAPSATWRGTSTAPRARSASAPTTSPPGPSSRPPRSRRPPPRRNSSPRRSRRPPPRAATRWRRPRRPAASPRMAAARSRRPSRPWPRSSRSRP